MMIGAAAQLAKAAANTQLANAADSGRRGAAPGIGYRARGVQADCSMAMEPNSLNRAIGAHREGPWPGARTGEAPVEARGPRRRSMRITFGERGGGRPLQLEDANSTMPGGQDCLSWRGQGIPLMDGEHVRRRRCRRTPPNRPALTSTCGGVISCLLAGTEAAGSSRTDGPQ